MLNIKGRSDLILKLEIIKKILFIPLFFIGYHFELIILLISLTVYYYVEFFFNTYYSERLFGYGTWKQIKDVLLILIISLFVSAIIWSVTLISFPSFFKLILQSIIFCAFYPLLFRLFKINEFNELIEILLEQIRDLRLKL